MLANTITARGGLFWKICAQTVDARSAANPLRVHRDALRGLDNHVIVTPAARSSVVNLVGGDMRGLCTVKDAL